MGHNLAATSLNRAKLTALPLGTPVIDANMTIYVKREHTMWEGEDGHKIQLDSLYCAAHKPIRRWKGLAR